MSAAMALGGFTGPEADTLGYAIRKKKSSVLRAQKEKFVTQAAERGVDAAGHRRGLHGLRAVRALRLQQGPRHLLRADRLPDRVPQGELHGRLHDRGADGVPRRTRRRSRPRSPSAAGWAIEVRPPDVHASHLEFTVEGDAIRFGLLAVKNVGAGRDRIDHRGARARAATFRSLTDFCTRIDLRLANRKVLEALIKVGALERVRASGPAPARPRRRDRGGPGDPARPDHRPDVAVRPGRRRGRGPRAAAADGDRGPGPRTAALGEGAARAVPLGASDGRGRRAGRPVRHRLLGRPAGRVARRPARRRRRDRDRRPDASSRRRKATMAIVDPRGPPGLDRGRRLPAAVRDRPRPTWREGAILLVAGRVDHKGEEVSLLADLVARLGRRRRPPGPGGVRARGRGGRSGGAAAAAAATAPGRGAGHGGAAATVARPGRADRSAGRSQRPAGAAGARRRRGVRSAAPSAPARDAHPTRGTAADRPGRAGLDLHRRRPRPRPSRPERPDDEPSVPDEARAPDRRRRDRRCAARRRPGQRSCTSGSRRPPRPTALVGAMEAFKASCATGRARPGS